MRSKSFPLVVILAGFLAAPLFAQENDPPSRVARLSFMNGKVSLQRSGENQWSQASLNYPLTTGDRIYADQDSRVEIEAGSLTVRISETTDLTITTLNDQIMQFGLAQGTARLRVFELASGNALEVDTPNGALALLGAGDYRIDASPSDGATIVSVFSGNLEIKSAGVSRTVRGGQAVRLAGTASVEVSAASLPEPDSFDRWSLERDRRYQTASANSGQYVNREIPGYADLDDYGRWQATPQYGPVWYPAAVPSGWVPYRHGHWLWIEPWGWTWVEDAPWGFAPFHYGRWVFVGAGWGWVPGPFIARPCYAPALVAFVGGPNFSIGIGIGRGGGHHAWFPLGPGEPFFPWYHHGEGYLHRLNNANLRNVRNVNEIHYVNRGNGTTVVPTPVFRSGQYIGHQAIRVDERQLVSAPIMPHPDTTPTAMAVTGGRPAAQVPSRTYHLPEVRQGLSPQDRGPDRSQVINRRNEVRNEVNPPQRIQQPQVMTRTPPPQPNPPFQRREPALREHPGRPLEPRQMDNVRVGKPAGPMHDREFPPHQGQSAKQDRMQERQKPEPKKN